MSFDLKIKNGDISIGSNGDFEKVEDTEKLVQDVLKILLTPVGANPFFRWYGSSLSAAMIGNPFDTVFIAVAAESQIRNALETVQNLQKTQAGSGQRVSAGELLAAVRNVQVVRNEIDPTYFTIAIKVLAKSLKTIPVTFEVQNL